MKGKYIIGISLLIAFAVGFSTVSAMDGVEASEKPDIGVNYIPNIVWEVPINVDDGTLKGTDNVVMGEAINSNDGAPPDPNDAPHALFPPPPYLQCYFDDGLSPPYNTLFADFRHYCDGIAKTWVLTVAINLGGSNYNITWNPADFAPSEYGSVYLRDAGTGVILADMLATGIYTETVTMDPGFYYYDITCENATCPVLGDNAYNPYVVNIPGDLDYSVSHTTDYPFNPDYQDTDLGSYDGGNDTVYRLEVSADTMIKISMMPDDSWTGIGLFTDSPDVPGTMVASDTGSDKSSGKDKGLREIEYTVLASESPYFLMCDSWPSPYHYNYDLDIIAIHDVGVTAINEPTLPVYNDTDVPVQVEVCNYGNDETSVPVHVWIENDLGAVPPDVLLDEDFESWPPSKGPTWQIINNAVACQWESSQTTGKTNPFGTGYGADANSDWCGWAATYPMDTDLITPSLDTTPYFGAITLEFDCYNYMSFSDEVCYFMYSPDGGSNWYNIITFDNMNWVGSYHWTVDCTGLQVSDLMFSWSYYAGGWDYGILIDNVYMEANLAAKDVVYDEYQYVDIDMGDCVDVDFSDWHVLVPVGEEGINFTVYAQTELPTDQDDTNNASSLGPFYVESGQHDVGFISVDTPDDMLVTGTHTVSGTVENFGDFPEFDVPVNCKIFKLTTPPTPSDLPYLEDFESAALGWSDWTVDEDPANGDVWTRTDVKPTGLDLGGATGFFAVFDDYGYGTGSDNTNEMLISPSISCAGESGVMLDFNGDFEDFAGWGQFWVNVSNDGGATFTNVFFETADVDPGGWDNHPDLPVDISAIADDQADVVIMFTYSDVDPGYGSYRSWGALIDDVHVYATPFIGQGVTKDTALAGKGLVLVFETTLTTAPVDVPIGGTASVTFVPDYNFAEAGFYLINLSTTHPLDEFPDNDEATKTVTVHEPNVWNCEQDLWFTTIQGAVDNANPGDHLMAKAMVFNENVNVYVEGVQIMPYEDDPPILNGNVSGNPDMGFNISADDVAICGFEILDCSFGAYVYYAMDTIIRNCTIHDNGVGIGLETPYVGTVAINYNHIYGNGVGVKNIPAPLKAATSKAGVILDEHFEDPWALDPDSDYYAPVDATYGNWDVDGVCNWYQSGYPDLTHYISQMADYGGYGLPYDGTYCAGAWWNDGILGDPNPDEWLKTPVMDLSGGYNMELSFYGIWLWDSVYNDHVTIEASTDGGSTWTVIADLLTDPAYEQGTGGPGGYGWCWNEYQVVLDVSAYASAQTQFAYHILGDPLEETTNGINYIDAWVLTGDLGPTHTLTIDYVGEGVVDPDGGTFPEDSVVVMTPIPEPGWDFDQWSGTNAGDVIDNGDGTYSILMDTDKFLTAEFKPGCVDCVGAPGIIYNWFGYCKPPWDPGCISPGIAIENTDDSVILFAVYNWFEAPDGPGGDIADAVTGRMADGLGNLVVGMINFDPWAGIDACMAEVPTSIPLGTSIYFDGSNSFGALFLPGFMTASFDVEYYWSFGDQFFSMEESTSHTYDEPGTYNAYLRVSANNRTLWPNTMYDWDRVTIEVYTPGTPLAANADGGGLGGYETLIEEEIQLIGSATGGTPPYTYYWDFGDEEYGMGQYPVHTYHEEGIYTVTLTVQDSHGSTATDTSTVTVAGYDELVANAGGPYEGAPSDAIYFRGSVTGGKAPYTYHWDFGDGSSANQQTPVHMYDIEGTYTVTLTVTDDEGTSDDHIVTVDIIEDVVSPEITNVKGGLGVKATIKAGEAPIDWSITVNGKYMFMGGKSSGHIEANAIETVKTPFTFAIGNCDVTIQAGQTTEYYEVFMLGPFAMLK
jgi:PKD repeat protein